MSFLVFLAALVAIIVFAVVINRVTGTKASYLEALRLAPGENELWRDSAADFATLPRVGQAAFTAYPRLRRHTVVWTDHRVIVAQKPLFSSKHMITHQIVVEAASAAHAAQSAAGEFGGGFYGRGYITIQAIATSFAPVSGKDCIRIQPSPTSGATLNLVEAYIFSDRLAELRQRLEDIAADARLVLSVSWKEQP